MATDETNTLRIYVNGELAYEPFTPKGEYICFAPASAPYYHLAYCDSSGYEEYVIDEQFIPIPLSQRDAMGQYLIDLGNLTILNIFDADRNELSVSEDSDLSAEPVILSDDRIAFSLPSFHTADDNYVIHLAVENIVDPGPNFHISNDYSDPNDYPWDIVDKGEDNPDPGTGPVEPSGPKDFRYTGTVQDITLKAGRYRLECWGAQGGSYRSYLGGKGGYSKGILTLTEATRLYVYVGGQPATNSSSKAVTSGGFNGGGNGQNRYYSSVYTYGQGGGGGTDIRIGEDSLYARVIVAGGGGGSASSSSTTKYGGGLQGGEGGSTSGAAYVAKQTAPSTSGRYLAGTFGKGANAYTSRTNYQYGSGGGGGGWYGGYAYNYSQDNSAILREYNGGGSGYVYTSETAKNYPSGCKLTSAHYLEEAETIAGNASFPSTSGSNETGHIGNGYVRITPLDISGNNNGTLHVKQNGKWIKVTKVYRKANGKWAEVSDVKTLFADCSDNTNSGYFFNK